MRCTPSMVASSRLAGMRSPGRKSPACTRARNWSRSWMYSGTWLCGWRWSGSIVSHLQPILPEIGLMQEPICLQAAGGLGRLSRLRRGRFVADAPVLLAGFQGADAQLRQVAGIALIDLLERKILTLNFMLPRFHLFRIIGGGRGYVTAGAHTNPELSGRRFIVGVIEAMSDAGTVHHVSGERHARPRRRPDGRYHPCSHRKRSRDFFRVGLQPIEPFCVLPQEAKEDHGARRKSYEVPLPGFQKSQETQREDGRNGR